LHAAQLSPVTLTRKLEPHEWERLSWRRAIPSARIDGWRAEAEAGFPEKVTAFRRNMAVHGRTAALPEVWRKDSADSLRGQPNELLCPVPNGWKSSCDRGLSRLLGSDWPRTLEELEALTRR